MWAVSTWLQCHRCAFALRLTEGAFATPIECLHRSQRHWHARTLAVDTTKCSSSSLSSWANGILNVAGCFSQCHSCANAQRKLFAALHHVRYMQPQRLSDLSSIHCDDFTRPGRGPTMHEVRWAWCASSTAVPGVLVDKVTLLVRKARLLYLLPNQVQNHGRCPS